MVFEKIREIIAEQTGKDVDEITLETNVKEDLDADSLDLFQIINDIEDEFDEEDVADIRQLSRHTYAVRALTDIDDFNAQFNTHFDDEEVDTIGGLVMQAFGHLPARGESIDIDGYQFKVAMADSRRIIQVHVKLPDDAPQPKLEE